ncbi:type II secretion system F family protein [Pseudoglutamicibacter albus]|uniref:Type II secretion system protein GspF domain-containing protein n=1 Tax=Pseudoglutamicibacter albus TaxID=98671 RepID=A0ABU1Z0T4_9MICC|nr:type II secretion system F family protein [Pseudoglutamicibacter albus]MDR7294229.1 hypothetical protein [Pseudoglutamicibacter albus]
MTTLILTAQPGSTMTLSAWICAGMLAVAIMAWAPRSNGRQRLTTTHPRGSEQVASPSARTSTNHLPRDPASSLADDFGDAEYAPLVAEALALCIESGMSLEYALTTLDNSTGNALGLNRVATALAWGIEGEKAFSYAPNAQQLGSFIQVSRSTGAPVAELLRQSSKHQRAANEDRMKAQAERLGVRVVIPLGLCALPAFICLGVIPVALALQPWSQ